MKRLALILMAALLTVAFAAGPYNWGTVKFSRIFLINHVTGDTYAYIDSTGYHGNGANLDSLAGGGLDILAADDRYLGILAKAATSALADSAIALRTKAATSALADSAISLRNKAATAVLADTAIKSRITALWDSLTYAADTSAMYIWTKGKKATVVLGAP